MAGVATWQLRVGKPSYTKKQKKMLDDLVRDLKHRMAKSDPRRYAHSISVAKTAEQMALIYGVDPFAARAAGILHDWDKVLTNQRQLEIARDQGIDLGVDLALVRPLLHGMTAANYLKLSYPRLPKEIWPAIARHTLGAADMSPLDMVIFVADGIEPLRHDVDAIHRVRKMVNAHAPLDEVYWVSFYQGVAYVIDTERYLYPGTLDIYNKLVQQRAAQK